MKLGYKRYIALLHTGYGFDGSYRQFWVDTGKQDIFFQDRNKNDSWNSKYFNGQSKTTLAILPIILLHVGALSIFKQFNLLMAVILFLISFTITDIAYIVEENLGTQKQPMYKFTGYSQLQSGPEELIEKLNMRSHQKKVQMLAGVIAILVFVWLMIIGEVSSFGWFVYLFGCFIFSDGVINRSGFLARWLQKHSHVALASKK